MDKLFSYLPSKELMAKDLPLALAMACMAVGTYIVVADDYLYSAIFYGLAVLLALGRMFYKEHLDKKSKKQ